jgi:hypothetical protein
MIRKVDQRTGAVARSQWSQRRSKLVTKTADADRRPLGRPGPRFTFHGSVVSTARARERGRLPLSSGCD